MAMAMTLIEEEAVLTLEAAPPVLGRPDNQRRYNLFARQDGDYRFHLADLGEHQARQLWHSLIQLFGEGASHG